MPPQHRTNLWLLLLLLSSGAVVVHAAIVNHLGTLPAPQQFFAGSDLLPQRQALLDLLHAVGNASDLTWPHNSSLPALGYGGNSSWGAADVSYCLWWGVTCCGTALTMEVPVCSHTHSVSALELPALGLSGVLPDVFARLPDLQVLDVSYNRDLRGALPDSLGSLPRLWRLIVLGTSMRCDDPAAQQPPPCPVPDWLVQQRHQYYYDRSGLECPVLTFREPRLSDDKMERVYRGAGEPEVIISDIYYGSSGCMAPIPGLPGFLTDTDNAVLAPAVLVIVILVPSLAVSVGLVLLSVALMRYLRYLKRSHDAIHLTEAWKRRNAPGLISDGNDRVLREVTLVITDVEGSTELWEWDYGVMTLAQEVHDSVMRSLIGRYCGYEVTTEGDSFTIAFHDAFDAVCWSLAMQQAMLEAEWPDELLTHDKAGVVYSSDSDSSRPGQLLFRGLRVRVAVSTGIPSMVYAHELTNTLTYAGPVMDLATALADLPAGGQILLGPQTFSNIAARLAELGVRLMLTETEAAAAAASASGAGGSRHPGASTHHTHATNASSHQQHHSRHHRHAAVAVEASPLPLQPEVQSAQSVFAKAASSAVALLGGGGSRTSGGSPHGDGLPLTFSKQQQQSGGLHGSSELGSTKLSEGSPFTQQSHLSAHCDSITAAAAADPLQPSNKWPSLAHTASAVGGSARTHQQQMLAELSAAGGGAGAAGAGGVRRTHSWWGWLGFTGGGSSNGRVQRSAGPNLGSSDFFAHSHGSGDGHSSGALGSLQHSSNGLLQPAGLLDPESGSGLHAAAAQLGSSPQAAARPSFDKVPRSMSSKAADAAGAFQAHHGGAVAIQDNEHIPMVIDLGSHWLDGLGGAAGSANHTMPGSSSMNPTSGLQGIRLTQIVTRQLAPRAAHFQPLATARQIYPSFFQAPSASDALLPDGLVFSQKQLPVVTIAFCAPDQAGLRPVDALSRRAAKQALEMFCSAVRTTLNACAGYECQEKDGIFMLAFGEAGAAVEWACLLNLALMCVHWSPEVLSTLAGREMCGPTGELLYRGIRARVGIYKGEITRIIPHRATGRADYFGPPVNRAARFLAASAPGQVLAERSLVQECVRAWSADDLQAKLAKRAMLQQASFTDSLASRRLSNTSTILGSAAVQLGGGGDTPPATTAASEAGDMLLGPAAAAAGADGALSQEPSQEPSQEGSQLAPAQTPSQQSSPPPSQQQQQPDQPPDAAAAADAVDDGGVGGGGAQQQQPKQKQQSISSFSFGMRQPAQLSPDRQESCQLMLRDLQQQENDENMQQQQPDPLQSRQQLQQQHDQAVRSKRALQQQMQQGQQQQQQLERVPETFGSPFSSAEKLPDVRAGSATAAGAAAAAAGSSGDRGSDDDAAAAAAAVAGAGLQRRGSSTSSTDSARMARQATLSAMLQAHSAEGSAASASLSPAASSGLEGSSTDAGQQQHARSGSGSTLRAYRSSSSGGGGAGGGKGGLPTLFEGPAGSSQHAQQQQQQQQQQQGPPLPPGPKLVSSGSGRYSEGGSLSPAASGAVAAGAGGGIGSSRLSAASDASDGGAGVRSSDGGGGGSTTPLWQQQSVKPPPAVPCVAAVTHHDDEQELYAGFEDASSMDEDESDDGEAAAVDGDHRPAERHHHLHLQQQSMSAEPPRLLRRNSATLRLRSMFSLRSSIAGSSITSSAGGRESCDSGLLGSGPLNLRHSSTAAISGSGSSFPVVGGGGNSLRPLPGFSSSSSSSRGPGAALLRTFSTFTARSSIQPRTSLSAAAADEGRAGSGSVELSGLRSSNSLAPRRPSIVVQRSGPSGTSAAAALAAAVYRNNTLCRQPSETGAAGPPLLPGTRSSNLGPQPSAAHTAAGHDDALQPSPDSQQQQQLVEQGSLYAPPAFTRHMSLVGTRASTGAAAEPQLRVASARRLSWAEPASSVSPSAAAAAAAASLLRSRQQQQQWTPAGLYGLLQDSAAPSPELQQQQQLLAQDLAGQSQQQQQQQHEEEAHGEEGDKSEPRLRVRPRPQPIDPSSTEQRPSTPDSGTPRSCDSPFRQSPTSAFASVASVCWERQQSAGAPLQVNSSPSTDATVGAATAGQQGSAAARRDGGLSRKLSSQPSPSSPTSQQHCAAQAYRRQASELSRDSAGDDGGGSAAAAGVEQQQQQQELLSQMTASQRALFQQRSLQERASSPDALPLSQQYAMARQLSLPHGAAASTAAAGAGGAAAGGGGSAHAGAMFMRQLSYYGQGSGGGGGVGGGEVLTGALPLEALPALRLGKAGKSQHSFMLQAIKDQVQRSCVQRRVPMRLQVHDIGVWTFKGISGAHSVVVLVPSRLAARMASAPFKKSSKAVCVQQPSDSSNGLLHELWVEVVNMDTILLDPELLMTAGLGGGGGGTGGGGGAGGQGGVAGGSGGVMAMPAGTPTAAPSTAGSLAGAASGWVPAGSMA